MPSAIADRQKCTARARCHVPKDTARNRHTVRPINVKKAERWDGPWLDELGLSVFLVRRSDISPSCVSHVSHTVCLYEHEYFV